MRYRDDLRSIAQRAFECVKRKGAIVADIDPAQNRALALTMEVPRHDVGVMLHHAQHDLVAGADVRKAEARRNEIDRLGRRSGENDLLVRGGVDEPPHGLSGRLVSLGRRIGEIVQAAMHIRILVLIGVRQAVDDLLRLLSRGGIIQIDERLAIRALGEDREIRPYRFNIVSVERRLHELVHVFAFTSALQATPPAGRAKGRPAIHPRSDRWIPLQKPRAASPWRRCLQMPRDCK